MSGDATLMNRWDCAKRLLDVFRSLPALADVDVSAGYPGDDAGPVIVWLDEIDGELEIPVMTAGRKHRDDLFTLPFLVRAMGVDADEARERVEATLAELESALADDPSVAECDGVLSAEVRHVRSVSFAIRGAGAQGFGQLVVDVHSRLT